MNLTEWILASAVVVLWLRLEVLFHKHDVLSLDHERACSDGDSRLKAIKRDTLSWLEFGAFSERIRARLDNLDPPRRRSTDQCDDICCKPLRRSTDALYDDTLKTQGRYKKAAKR